MFPPGAGDLNEPYPFRDALVDNDGYATREFDLWLQQHLIPAITATSSQVNVLADDEVTDSVALTEIVADASGGFYRFNPFVQCLTPAGVSSSAQVTLTWEFNGQVLTQAFTNVNGNLVTSLSSDAPFVFRVTAGTPISYTVTYASNPANAAVFSVTSSLELMRALG